MNAHDVLREALRSACLADLDSQLQQAHADNDYEWIEQVQSKIDFVKTAVLADYVIGSMYVDLGGEKDYHNIIRTDGAGSLHRILGLSQMTTDFLRDI